MSPESTQALSGGERGKTSEKLRDNDSEGISRQRIGLLRDEQNLFGLSPLSGIKTLWEFRENLKNHMTSGRHVSVYGSEVSEDDDKDRISHRRRSETREKNW